MSFAVSSERTHCKVGPRRAQMDAIVVPQEPPPRTTTLGWRGPGVMLTVLCETPSAGNFSDLAILADAAGRRLPPNGAPFAPLLGARPDRLLQSGFCLTGDRGPQVAVRSGLVPGRPRQRNGYKGQPPSPGADDRVGLACHASVNGRMTQSEAEVGVPSVGRQAADHVTRIDVLQRYR